MWELTQYVHSEGKIGDLYGAYVVPLLDAVKIIKLKKAVLQGCIDSSSTLFGQSALH